jgi:Ala-tRNA(Pro) deacylase
MPVQELSSFLEHHHVGFETLPHPSAFTAQETAESAHIPGKSMAKTVIVKLDGELAMAVLPAPDRISPERLQHATGAHEVELASERDFADRFAGCEVGAMPPFGNLWGMQVFVDQRLREDEQIVFNGGTHTELVKIPYSEYERLVHPVVARISETN